MELRMEYIMTPGFTGGYLRETLTEFCSSNFTNFELLKNQHLTSKESSFNF